MPGYDGTGPEGVGPNGWGNGPCGRGRGSTGRRGIGFRRGRGRGRGLGGFLGIRSDWDDREVLEAEKTWLQRRLAAVEEALKGDETEG
ncbi:DUF5320 family protein [bacterium]|nr:DUF5320 family protein [bacterium]